MELLVLLLAMIAQLSHCSNILVMWAPPSHSHMALKSSLVTELSARGHHITAVTPLPEKAALSNYKEILIPGVFEALKKLGSGNLYDKNSDSIIQSLTMWTFASQLICQAALGTPGVQELFRARNVSFDLILLEAHFSDCFLHFAHKFKAPIAKFCSYGGSAWMFDSMGSPNPFSHVPDMNLDYTERMTFYQRLWNAVIGSVQLVVRRYHLLPTVDRLIRETLNTTEELPSLLELDFTATSILMLNTHFSVGFPRALTPNIIEVAGIHVKPARKLPQDIETFLDEAPHGAIFFSMGSILRSSDLPEATANAFLEAFSKLKEKVLWKWETEVLPRQPKNVRLGKWLPQSDILAHPNVKAFITHGGLLSAQEALHWGVPVVGIPIFGDQKLNVARSKAAGYGVLLDFHNITTESVIWALREILDNPEYREKAQRISRAFRDQPLTPLQQAVYWTEYVIRHKGAPHMRSAALDLTWYQYFLLDVITVLVLAAGIVVMLLFIISRAVIRTVFKVTKRNAVSVDRKSN